MFRHDASGKSKLAVGIACGNILPLEAARTKRFAQCANFFDLAAGWWTISQALQSDSRAKCDAGQEDPTKHQRHEGGYFRLRRDLLIHDKTNRKSTRKSAASASTGTQDARYTRQPSPCARRDKYPAMTPTKGKRKSQGR